MSMHLLPEIYRSSHLQPSAHQQRQQQSCADLDPVTEEEDEDTDDDRTLADLKRKRGAGTSQEDMSFPCGAIFPVPSKRPRVAAWKRRAIISACDDDDDDKQPHRYEYFLAA